MTSLAFGSLRAPFGRLRAHSSDRNGVSPSSTSAATSSSR
jgi:hypothetical protein